MRIKYRFIFMFIMLPVSVLKAQESIVPLWMDEIPGAILSTEFTEELEVKNGQTQRIRKVTNPTISIYKTTKTNGSLNPAILIFPGGGYQYITMEKEGVKVAKWLNELGITAIIVKYRLPNDTSMKNKTIGPLQDAQQAMRYVRRNAKDLEVNPNSIGVLGFSAGGHLASTISTQFNKNIYLVKDPINARPDFSILIYPVISMKEKITHQGSKNNLLGVNPSEELVENFSNEVQVDSMTPKTFIVHSSDDRSVPVENSLDYYRALKKNNVPVEMHIYEDGGHGFGLGKDGSHKFWPIACENWLRSNRLIE